MIISKTPFRISLFGGGTDFPKYYEKYNGKVIGFTFDRYELHDHSVISLTDILDLPDDKPILITEKDAVKIDFPTNRSIWVVKIKPKFNHDVCQMVEDCLLSKHLLKLPLNHCDSQI